MTDHYRETTSGTDTFGSIAVGGNITSGMIHAGEGAIGSVSAGTYSGLPGGWQDQATACGNIAGISITAQTSIGDIHAYAAIGYDAFISNVSINTTGSIGNITAASGISGNITAEGANSSIGSLQTTRGDIVGNITATYGNISSITLGNGSLLANLTAGGSIGDLTIANNISGNITAGGNIGNITACNGSIAGNITASNGNIGNIAARGSILGNITTTSLSNQTLRSIGEIIAGGSLSGIISAAGNIGFVDIGLLAGTLSGSLSALDGSLGLVWSAAWFGQVGGGTQFDSYVSVKQLIDLGFIERVGQ